MRLSISTSHNLNRGVERVEALPERLTGAMRSGTRRAAELVEEDQKQTISRKTGRTADTIRSVVEDMPGGAAAYVGTSDKIARILDQGSKSHKITARNAKALGPMQIGGRTVFAKSVMHPGTKAQRWLERSGQLSVDRVGKVYEDEVGEVFR